MHLLSGKKKEGRQFMVSPLKSKIIHLALSSSPSDWDGSHMILHHMPRFQNTSSPKSSAPTLSDIILCLWNIRYPTPASRNLYLPNLYLYYHYPIQLSTQTAVFHTAFIMTKEKSSVTVSQPAQSYLLPDGFPPEEFFL